MASTGGDMIRKAMAGLALVAAGAAGGLAIGSHHAAPQGAQLHTLMGAVVRGETFGIDGRTYVARVVSGR